MGRPTDRQRCAINRIAATLNLARQYAARGDAARAEQFFLQVVATDKRNREALESLVMICLQSGRPDTAETYLRQLTEGHPAEPLYCDRLATLLSRRGRGVEAIDCYRRLLANRPGLTNSRYNLARLLKQEGHLQEALEEYQRCLKRKIERPEEVHTNISAIHTTLHQHERASKSLQAALGYNPRYIPALFNLAQLQEEEGNWDAASASYRRILKLDPLHPGALAQLANGELIEGRDNPVISAMRRALQRDGLAIEDKEALLYALGKGHDDCQRFDEAFDYYRQANQLSAGRCGSYDPAALERVVDQLIATCNANWLGSIEPVTEAPLVFIVGMFRSGTTLLEQILSSHPALTAGGELNFFQRAISPYPAGLLALVPAQLHAIGQEYIEYLAGHFPAGTRVSNKRPDNFLCLGLLRALYPGARIVNTLRQPEDTCISLYFQPLDASQPYANDLLDAGHYYRQYRRLMQHWRSLPGAAVLDIEYEALVVSPREIIGEVLGFLELDWHEGCMAFHTTPNRVRTASVHQVRRPLYNSSSGRWQNYAAQLEELHNSLQQR